MRLDFDVFGDVQVSREILRVGEHADDARPAWRAILDDLLDINTEQFRTEGGRAHKWDALQQATIDDKARQRDLAGAPSDILVRSGGLRDAATSRGADGQEIHIEPGWFAFLITEPAARYHQLGRGVPQRRIIDLTERDRSRWVRILQRWIVTGEVTAL